MATVLGAASLAAVVVASIVALAAIQAVSGWAHRRDLQMGVLALPLASLGLAAAGLHRVAGQVCWLGVPPWDYALGAGLAFGMGATAVGALVAGGVRLALVARLLLRGGVPAGAIVPELQATTDRLAACIGAPPIVVRLCGSDRPLALTHGWRHPTLLLSTWMVEHLDRQELESVLAHEVAHAARRDYPVTWLAVVLRDAFCYLPTSRVAFARLRDDNELACDDLAVAATRHPLALAGALAKVWQYALAAPGAGGSSAAGPRGTASAFPVGGAPALCDGEQFRCAVQRRIERLLVGTGPVATWPRRPRSAALGVGATGFGGLLALAATNAAVMLAPMGCGPHAPLFHLLRII
jgi:Zn-dependent protease with chaperone function